MECTACPQSILPNETQRIFRGECVCWLMSATAKTGQGGPSTSRHRHRQGICFALFRLTKNYQPSECADTRIPEAEAGKSSAGQDWNLRIHRYPACDASLHYQGYGNPCRNKIHCAAVHLDSEKVGKGIAAFPRLQIYSPCTNIRHTTAQQCNTPGTGKSSAGQDSTLHIRRYPACDASLHSQGYGSTTLTGT